MKSIKYLLILPLLVINITACKKTFLDVDDDSIILREQYVKDLGTLQQYLNGIYILLARDFYHGSNGPQIYTDLTADNIKPNTTNTSTLFVHYFWNQNTSTSSSNRSNMANLWKNGYNLIRSCSFAIDKAKEFKGESTETANRILGEAYSLRALAHFVLVNVFAQSYNFSGDASHLGVPYITSWDWNDAFKRNSVAEVYDGMIIDLKAAIPLLPATLSTKITMNQYAAKALLARIFLFMENWQQAKTIAIEITSAVPLLASKAYPSKLFTPEETEAFFQLAPSSSTAINGSYTTAFQGYLFRSTAFLATKDVADLLKQNPHDSRIAWISSSSIGKDSIRKYPLGLIPNSGSLAAINSSYYQTLLRSSEMFLTVAEAAARLGEETTARTYLDAIRQRANPTAANTTATGTSLLDSIYLERRKELAFEGFRMWDLLRWKKGVKREDGTIGSSLELSYPNNKAVAPIPIEDVNYGIPQNPSY